MITHLFFDAGNTLVYVNMERVSLALARRSIRVEPGRLWQGEYRTRRWLDTPDVIRRSTDDSRVTLYFREILKECGVRRPGVVDPVLREIRAYHEAHNIWEVVPPGLPLLLDRLRARYRLSVISNSNGTVREKLRRTGLWPYFEVVFDSREMGIEKPDPRIFRLAMERTGARPERSLYVGDLYHVDVAGARAAGMRAVLLDPGSIHGDKPVERAATLSDLPDGISGNLIHGFNI